MSKRIQYLFFSLLLIFLVAGCKPECENNEYATFDILLDSPPFNEMVSYQEPITFDWHHNESCEPGQYRITVKDLVDNQSIDFGGDLEETEYTQTFAYYEANDFRLRANREYEWSVIAASEDWGGISPPSQTWKFRTDGLCSTNELVPPVLFHPADQNWLELGLAPDNSRLIWEYPGDCFPEFYHYQLAADPNFTNIITSGITDFSDAVCGEIPGNCFSNFQNELQGKIFDSVKVSVPECARVYWRVEARRGQDIWRVF